tara:strand:+ start:4663 stop:5157 length:495 start_codon:yes stop_codon:yes gene_type:complete
MFDFEGSPYYENDFVEGKVTNNKGESEDLYFCFNVLDEVFHVKKNLNSSKVYELPDVSDLLFSTKDCKYLRKDKNSNLPGGNLKYVIEFRNEKNYQVVGVPMIDVFPAIPTSTPYHSTRNGKYKIVTIYYASLDNEEFSQLDLKGKDLAENIEHSNFLKKLEQD